MRTEKQIRKEAISEYTFKLWDELLPCELKQGVGVHNEKLGDVIKRIEKEITGGKE